ncbi:MAG: RNA 2',3'-cyclic phosphodiesterase [Vicinamibacterales bacterium]
MRLFVAVEIDPQVARKIGECSDELRRRVGQHAPRARVSWVPADRLHVTVRFIGETDEAQAAHIASSLQAALGVEPFDAAFHGVGAFPERGVPRVFWAGMTAGAAGLTAVEEAVTARLAACGVPPEGRPYRPHVTLARVREASGLRPRALFDGLIDRPFGVSPVGAITLFQSRPSPNGSVYVPLQTTRLRSSA